MTKQKTRKDQGISFLIRGIDEQGECVALMEGNVPFRDSLDLSMLMERFVNLHTATVRVVIDLSV